MFSFAQLSNPAFLRSAIGSNSPLEVEPIVYPLTGNAKKKVPSSSDNLIRKTGYHIVPFNGKFYYYKHGNLVKRSEFIYEFSDKRSASLREGFVVIDKVVYYVTLEDLKRGIVRTSRKLELKRGTLTYHDFLTGNIFPANRAGVRSAQPSSSSSTVPGTGINSSVGTSLTEVLTEGAKLGALFGPGTGTHVAASTTIHALSEILAGGNPSRVGAGGTPGNGTGSGTSTLPNSTGADSVGQTASTDVQGFSPSPELDELEAANLAFQNQVGSLLDLVSEEEGSEWEVSQTT